MIVRQLVVGSMSVCCYLAICEKTKKAVVIDPGGDEERILKAVNDEQATVEYIINTHGHPDHDCGNGKLKEATGALIIIHTDDAEFFAKPEVKHYFSVLGLPESPPADKTVKDGEVISFGEEHLTVIHTPGHTPGGMCLYSPPNLFTGDTLFVGGVGRTDFPGGETKTLTGSIRNKLLVLPGDTVVWPGHGYGGDSSTIATEARTNPFLTGDF
jgi:glyoxylase-like metal-dependent hydrolase (beta-lactamase superfamily II)